MARALDVYLKQELVGRLEQNRSGSIQFGYDTAWLASTSAVALSHSLPLRNEPFRWKECRAFFAGLLPEEDSRRLIAKVFGISDTNDFALLERIGAECAGAVSLLRPGELPLGETPRYRRMTIKELADKFVHAGLPQPLAGDGDENWRRKKPGAGICDELAKVLQRSWLRAIGS